MNKQAILHLQDSNYAYPKSVDKFVVRLRVARNDDIQKVIIEYGCKYTFYDVRFEKEMKIKYKMMGEEYKDSDVSTIRFIKKNNKWLISLFENMF